MSAEDFTRERLNGYLSSHGCASFDPRGVFFDMDGVLFDSMRWHARTWVEVMTAHGLHFTAEDAYMNEGRTGAGTIDLIMQRECGRHACEADVREIYGEKTAAFRDLPEAPVMPGALRLVQAVTDAGLSASVVTGSAQSSLMDRIDHCFNSLFRRDFMVTAFDVKTGKPDPEPYLMALHKSGLRPEQAFVVENAPLGVEAGAGAGIFVIAVNIGPLPDEVLWQAGAGLVYPSVEALADDWVRLLGLARGADV